MKDFRAAQMKIKKLEQAMKKHKYGSVIKDLSELPMNKVIDIPYLNNFKVNNLSEYVDEAA